MKKNRSSFIWMVLFILMLIGWKQEITAAGIGEGFLPGGAWEQDLGIEIQIPESADIIPYRNEHGTDLASDDTGERITAERAGHEASYDPRETGMVSPVRDQGKTALCWDYAALSTTESAMIRAGMTDNRIDLSELHSAYHSYVRRMEQREETDLSFWDFCMNGGSPLYVWDLFAGRIGPVKSSADEEINEVTVSENTIAEMVSSLENAAELAVIYSIDAGDRDGIKDAIREYGAVCGLYYSYGAYYRDLVNEKGDTSYHMPYPVKTANHAISIVGWDDEFQATLFEKDFYRTETDDGTQEDLTLPNGAWLVKNSWGEKCYKTGEKASGYYWISYYDRSLQSLMAVQLREVGQVPESIVLSEKKICIQEGARYEKKLIATVEPEQAECREYAFTSTDETVASITPDGWVTGNSKGTCKIRVRTKEGFTYDECLVTVTEKTAETEKEHEPSCREELVNMDDSAALKNDKDVRKLQPSDDLTPDSNAPKTDRLDHLKEKPKDNFQKRNHKQNNTSSSKRNGRKKRPILYRKGTLLYEIANGKAVVIKAVKQRTTIRIPDTIKRKGKKYPVVKIKNGVFRNNVRLKKVRIGKHVKMIEAHAFDGCKNLQRIIIH